MKSKLKSKTLASNVANHSKLQSKLQSQFKCKLKYKPKSQPQSQSRSRTLTQSGRSERNAAQYAQPRAYFSRDTLYPMVQCARLRSHYLHIWETI